MCSFCKPEISLKNTFDMNVYSFLWYRPCSAAKLKGACCHQICKMSPVKSFWHFTFLVFIRECSLLRDDTPAPNAAAVFISQNCCNSRFKRITRLISVTSQKNQGRLLQKTISLSHIFFQFENCSKFVIINHSSTVVW